MMKTLDEFFPHGFKTKKKVTMYRPIVHSREYGCIMIDAPWTNDKSFFGVEGKTIIGWQECEVSVDD